MRTLPSSSRLRCFLFLALVTVIYPRESKATTDYPSCMQLGNAITDHSCLHAQFGPFGDGSQLYPVTSSASESVPLATPNVNQLHTFYAVTLAGGSTGAWEGTVKYRPARTGDWAIYLTPDAPVPAPPSGTSAPPPPPPPRPTIPIKILTPTDVVVPIELQHAVAGCDRLPRVYIAHLTALTTYRFVLGASPVATVGVVVEKLGDFETMYNPDADGDGFGNPASSQATPCLPPARLRAECH